MDPSPPVAGKGLEQVSLARSYPPEETLRPALGRQAQLGAGLQKSEGPQALLSRVRGAPDGSALTRREDVGFKHVSASFVL